MDSRTCFSYTVTSKEDSIIADQKLSSFTPSTGIDRTADLIYVVKKVGLVSQSMTPNSLLGITGAPIGDTDTQTLSNKTLTAPIISSPVLSGTVSGTYTIGGTPTFPAAVVTLTASQTLTNKILTSPTINAPTITNASLTADAITGFSTANTGTIYGVGVTAGIIASAALVNSVNTAALQSGAVTASKIGTDSSFAYASWSPTFTNLTVGNGTVIARYTQIGKMVEAYLYFILGLTSTVGTSPTFTLPVAASSNQIPASGSAIIGNAIYTPAGSGYDGICFLISTGVVLPAVYNASGTYVQDNGLTASVPNTWASTNYMRYTIRYEAA